MIHVIATVKIKVGKRDEFLRHLRANVPHVRDETGCIEYSPVIDLSTDIPSQTTDQNEVIVIEKWESLARLQDHFVAPHMQAYKQAIADLVENVSLRVLK